MGNVISVLKKFTNNTALAQVKGKVDRAKPKLARLWGKAQPIFHYSPLLRKELFENQRLAALVGEQLVLLIQEDILETNARNIRAQPDLQFLSISRSTIDPVLQKGFLLVSAHVCRGIASPAMHRRGAIPSIIAYGLWYDDKLTFNPVDLFHLLVVASPFF